MATWTGTVHANAQTPTSTQITVDEGDTIRITATGFVSKDGGDSWNGPEGLYGNIKSSHVDPSVYGGSLLLQLGNTYYAYQAVALSPLKAPAGGTVKLVVNDTQGSYGDNQGSFHVAVEANAQAQTQQFNNVFEIWLHLTLVDGQVVQEFSIDNENFYPLEGLAIYDTFTTSGTLTFCVTSKQSSYNALAQSLQLVSDNAPTASPRWTAASGSGTQQSVTVSLAIPGANEKNQFDIAVGLKGSSGSVWADPIAIIRRI